MRKSYEASCEELIRQGVIDEVPPMPTRQPAYDDELLGLEFFRTEVADLQATAMTLPRTFFGRSRIAACSFVDTDLSESTLCWNDFEDVDFSRAGLGRADLRSSLFLRCRFDGADLSEADLRRSTFEECTFVGTAFLSARLTRGQASALPLTSDQRLQAAVTRDEGPEPPGG